MAHCHAAHPAHFQSKAKSQFLQPHVPNTIPNTETQTNTYGAYMSFAE